MEVGALTRFPPQIFSFIGSSARLPLPLGLPRRHVGEGSDSLFHARGLAVASFSQQSEARADELVAAEQTKPESVTQISTHQSQSYFSQQFWDSIQRKQNQCKEANFHLRITFQ